MNQITRRYELAAPAEAVEREWHAVAHDAELRGALEAHFEPLEGGGTRLSVATAREADGERRIESVVARLRRALERESPAGGR